MIIPYIKDFKTGRTFLLHNVNRLGHDNITYCCADMMLQIQDTEFTEITNLDPPRLLFKNAQSVKIVRFCPNCGEKVETKRIEKLGTF